MLDNTTWRQFIHNAMRRCHGVFGEAIEYYFLSQENNIAYLKVNRFDKDNFSSGLSLYISSEELVGTSLVATIIQESDTIESLIVAEEDQLWLKRVIEECREERECTT
ncbi:LAFE_0H11760g1_1 [Lachancea fermentati]|uniref:LAFE_0H11760g1_1 n=1 Tax=Lachancea fermentati TaxID=4955 RepID=A0A1G4MKK0_LACFM|nr:LAFE_0H11760g1_1 [Lachancea fermentati]